MKPMLQKIACGLGVVVVLGVMLTIRYGHHFNNSHTGLHPVWSIVLDFFGFVD